MSWVQYALVGLGSALGGMSRFLISGLVAQRFPSFPYGTLTVNVAGSFLIGLIAALSAVEGRFFYSPSLRNFLMTGVMGGFTTFSSFSLQTLNLAQDGQWLYAGMNILASLVLCLAGVWLGYLLGQALN